jgi:hypothetical protein
MAFKFKVSARSEWFLGIDRLGSLRRFIEIRPTAPARTSAGRARARESGALARFRRGSATGVRHRCGIAAGGDGRGIGVTRTIPIVFSSTCSCSKRRNFDLTRSRGRLFNLVLTFFADPKPFIWTKSAGEILKKVGRTKQALESQY